MTKICTKCGKTKYINEFYAGNQCKVCVILRNTAYKKTEAGKQTSNRYEQAIKGKVRRKKAITKYHKTEKGKIAQAKAKQNRAPYILQYTKEWRQTSTGQVSSKKHKANKRKAGTITAKLIKQIEQDNIDTYGTLTCEYCKEPVDKYHLEHMQPISKGGMSEYINLCIACPECNLSKGIMTADEYRKGLKVI